MRRAEQYMHLAADVRAKAELEDSPIIRAEWENLAETYVRLAEQSGGTPNASTYYPIQDTLTGSQPKKKKRWRRRFAVPRSHRLRHCSIRSSPRKRGPRACLLRSRNSSP